MITDEDGGPGQQHEDEESGVGNLCLPDLGCRYLLPTGQSCHYPGLGVQPFPVGCSFAGLESGERYIDPTQPQLGVKSKPIQRKGGGMGDRGVRLNVK